MPRRSNSKPSEDSPVVQAEVATPEVAPQLPQEEPSVSPKTQTKGEPKRYKSPNGFIIEDF